jgi:hypothetical protein
MSGRKRHVDHDHNRADKRVRGVLCAHCNWLIGHARNDPNILRAGAAYLERNNDCVVVHAGGQDSAPLPPQSGTRGAYAWLRSAARAQAKINGHQ